MYLLISAISAMGVLGFVMLLWGLMQLLTKHPKAKTTLRNGFILTAATMTINLIAPDSWKEQPVDPVRAAVANTAPTMLPEEALAIIEMGSSRTTPEAIARYASLLDHLAPKCGESRNRIADYAANSISLIRERSGKLVTPAHFLNELNVAIPEGMSMDCADLSATLVILMTN